MKARFLLSNFTCLILFISLISFSPDPHSGLLQDVLSQTNQFRTSNGLPALLISSELNAIAQKHSENMAHGKIGFGHNGFSKRNSMAKKSIKSISSFAENVAYGVTSAKAVVTGWKNSPGHRQNMLGRYKYIGIGIAKDRRGRIYYTQIFAG